MDELHYLELSEVAELIRQGEVTSEEVTSAQLERIEKLDGTLKSYRTVDAEGAIEAAKAADADRRKGRIRSGVHGVPVGIKDLANTKGLATGAGTSIHDGFVPDFDATIVVKLREAGAVNLGKLAMTEGAYSGHHPDLQTPVNPWDEATWPGVSSSGSGVAPAAGLCFGAIGTDTGGSIRLPSSANGVTGLKPTWGRVSRYGCFPLAQSLDHIGPMARSARDCAIMLEVLAGRDKNDPTASRRPVPRYSELLDTPRPWTVGIDPKLNSRFDDVTQRMLAETADVFRELGWTVVEVSTPGLPEAGADWTALCAAETADVHRENYPSRASEYGPELASLIDIGLELSAIDYASLQERRRNFTGKMADLMSGIDFLLLPAVGQASPTNEEMASATAGSDILERILIPTGPIDMCGFPAVTFPTGFTSRGTPLGAQLVGAPWTEAQCMAAAHGYQETTDFHLQRPKVG